MSNPLLILNAGPSSVKFSIFETAENRSLVAGFHGSVEKIETAAFRGLDGGQRAGRRLPRRVPPSLT